SGLSLRDAGDEETPPKICPRQDLRCKRFPDGPDRTAKSAHQGRSTGSDPPDAERPAPLWKGEQTPAAWLTARQAIPRRRGRRGRNGGGTENAGASRLGGLRRRSLSEGLSLSLVSIRIRKEISVSSSTGSSLAAISSFNASERP
ncbi:unnamed protein product, partial [Staurois parvus]